MCDCHVRPFRAAKRLGGERSALVHSIMRQAASVIDYRYIIGRSKIGLMSKPSGHLPTTSPSSPLLTRHFESAVRRPFRRLSSVIAHFNQHDVRRDLTLLLGNR